MDDDLSGGGNQEEGKDPGSVLSKKNYIITHGNCPAIWAIWLQTEIALGTSDVEYISLYQARRYVLPFFIPLKEIKFILKLKGDTPKVMCSVFKKSSHI